MREAYCTALDCPAFHRRHNSAFCASAGIEDFRFHDLRHTWASWHVQSGISLPELMELSGWKSYEMVLRYAHLAPEKLSSVASRIELQASRPAEPARLNSRNPLAISRPRARAPLKNHLTKTLSLGRHVNLAVLRIIRIMRIV